MRAFPLVVALAFATPVQAQLRNDTTHPPVVAHGVTAEIRTMWQSTSDTVAAFAWSGFSSYQLPEGGYQFEIGSLARAVAPGHHSETLIDATFTVTEPIIFTWVISGPATLDLVGPGVNEHLVVTDWRQRNGDRGDALPPGVYDLTITQSLVAGQWPETASVGIVAHVVPEPSTLILAASWLLALATHRLRRSGFRLHRRSWSPA